MTQPSSEAAAHPGSADPTADYRTDDARWQAVANRDPRAAGRFWIGVVTTGIYCKPACPSRQPLRKNVTFHDSPALAVAAGFRACKRCHPG